MGQLTASPPQDVTLFEDSRGLSAQDSAVFPNVALHARLQAGISPALEEHAMGWVVLGLIAAVAVYLIMTYNGLVAMRQRVGQAFADIDVQLKQRHDLIPNLVETVKGYATHEKSTLDAVIAARNAAQGAGSVHDKAAAEQQLSGAMGRLLALGEAYPDLKASANFQQLQVDLGNVEDKLAAARRFFNNAVSEFNAAIQAFPAVLFAPQMGFTPREFFDVGETVREQIEVAPSVKF